MTKTQQVPRPSYQHHRNPYSSKLFGEYVYIYIYIYIYILAWLREATFWQLKRDCGLQRYWNSSSWVVGILIKWCQIFIYTLSTHYLHSIYALSTNLIYLLSTRYLHFIYTSSIPYLHLIHTLSTPYLHLIYTYLHLIYTVWTTYPHCGA